MFFFFLGVAIANFTAPVGPALSFLSHDYHNTLDKALTEESMDVLKKESRS